MMRRIVRRRRTGQFFHLSAIATAMAMLIGAAPAVAQDVEAPFTGVVVSERVPVRSGTGSAFYKVGELERGAIVEVEEVSWGWFRIRPPKGVYSYISKAFVDASGDGKVGEVNSEMAKVKAARLSGPGQSYKVHAVLNKGASVRIVDEEGSFYKIIPPDDASVFLPPGSVKPRSSEEAQQVLAEQGEDPSSDPVRATIEPPDDADSSDSSSDTTGASRAEANAPATSASADEAEAEADDPAEAATAMQDGSTSDDTDQTDEAATAADEAAADHDDETDDQTVASDDDAESTEASSESEPAEQTVAVDESDADDDDSADDVAVAGSEEEAADEGEPVPSATQTVSANEGKDVAAVTPAVSDRLKRVERQNIPLFMKPLEEQPLEEMIADYEALEQEMAGLPAVDQRIVRMRLAALRRNQQLAETLGRINQARQSIDADRELPTRLREDAEISYDAVGKLLASGVYDGRTLPRMFRLIDPATGRTLAYIEPTDPVIPHEMLGEVVGVVGRKQYNDALKLQMINVEKVNVLRAKQPQAQDAEDGE
ncbi:MAG: SH3 domain-containing protein [Phycisphaeraceae bacterium]